MNNGFSLLELLAVFVIVGILTAVAYPGYRHYIVRAHRSDGQTSLLDLANRMENYYSANNSYQTATIGHGGTTDVLSNSQSGDGWYNLSITHATDSAYTLQATPTGTQATGDLLCQALTFNSVGIKGLAIGPTGAPTGSIAQCW